jgi:DNA-binding ferritin-like protein
MNLQQLLLKLLVCLRTKQLFYHQAHNVCGRVPFFADHEALGEFYGEVESQYDRLAERIVGTFSSLPLKLIVGEVNQKLQALPELEALENKKMFELALSMESELQQLGEAICKSPGIAEGTRQLVGDLLDSGLSRMYKIKQRIK